MLAESVSETPGALLFEGDTLEVDGYLLHARVSSRRTRLGLTVERDGSLTLRAPDGCPAERARQFVRDSRQWLEEKRLLSEQRRQPHPVRTLQDGEIHRYLGRDYKLLVVDGPRGTRGPVLPVRLVAGHLQLDRSVAGDPRDARKALAGWYSRVGQRWVQGRLQPWAARMDVPEPRVEVRDLGHRWGTYRSGKEGGRLAVHWAVFQLPMHLVDYVTAHELAHARIGGHGPAYWRLLGRALPEARRLKAELDELGRRVWMGDVETRCHDS